MRMLMIAPLIAANGFACESVHAQSAAAPDIIVTAEKRSLPLQQTTTSVVSLSSEAMRQGGIESAGDAYDRAANVSPVYGTGISIRGISDSGVSVGGDAATITVFLDGVPLAATFLQAAPTDLWDTRSIEILRGPQSTLRGLNTLAGAVVIQSRDPLLDRWEASARLIATDEAQGRVAASIGGALVPDSLGIRLAAEYQKREGFIRNVTRGDHEDSEERLLLRAKLLWQPLALPGLTAKVGFTHFRREGGFYNVYARTDVPGFPDKRVATDDVPNRTDLDFDAITGELRYTASDHLTLTGETTWSRATEVSSYDSDYSALDASFGRQRRRYDTFTQELRLNLDGRSLSGVAGLYFYDRDLASRQINRTDVPTPTATIAGLLRAGGLPATLAASIAGSYTQAMPAIRVDFDGSFPIHVRTYASFADLRYALANRLSLLAGARLDREVNTSQNVQNSIFAGTYPSPDAFGPFAPVVVRINGAVGSFVAQSNGSLPPVHRGFTTFLPKAGLLMAWSDKLSTAFVVQRGYRSGGSSTNIARGQSFAYDPEYTWNYELSLRAHLLGDKLRLAGNAYYISWRNQQVSVNFGLNAYDINTVNAGKSHLYGVELDAEGALTAHWSTYVSLGYERTRFDEFTIPGLGRRSNLSGQVFAYAPEWTIVAGTRFRLTSGFAGNFNLKHTSSAFGSAGIDQASYPVAAHTIADARLGYEAEHWSIYAEAKNLFNDVYTAYKSPMETRAVLNAPRTLGIVFEARI